MFTLLDKIYQKISIQSKAFSILIWNERLALETFGILQGYDHEGKLTKSKIFWSRIYDSISCLLLIRGVLLCCFDSSSPLKLILGHNFNNSKVHRILNLYQLAALTTVVGFKHLNYHYAIRSRVHWQTFLRIIKRHGFDFSRLQVSKSQIDFIVKLVLLMINYPLSFIGLELAALVVYGYSFLIDLQLPHIEPLISILQFFWLLVICLMTFFGASCTIWVTYNLFIFTSIIHFKVFNCSKILTSENGLTSTQLSVNRLIKLTQLLNEIEVYNAEVRWYFFLGYNPAALLSDLGLYMFFYSNAEAIYKWFLLGVSFIAITLVIPLILSFSVISNRIDYFSNQIFSLIRKGNIRGPEIIQALTLVERINSDAIGFTIGTSFRLTTHNFFIYLAENGSILMLLITMTR